VPRFWQPHLMTTPKTVRIRGDFGPNCSHTRSACGPHMPGDAVQLFSHQINALKRATLIAQLQTGTIVSPGTPQGGTSISRAMTRSPKRDHKLECWTGGLPGSLTAGLQRLPTGFDPLRPGGTRMRYFPAGLRLAISS